MADKIKIVLAILIIAGGIAGFYYYADYALLYRVMGLLALVGVSVVVALQTELGRNTANFGREAFMEVRKVVWPTRAETMQTTLIVMVMVGLIGLLLWLFDMTLLWAVKLLTGQGG